MSIWVSAADLPAHARFGLEGAQHEVRDLSRDRSLVWVATAAGRLIPLHETERVLVLDDADDRRASASIVSAR